MSEIPMSELTEVRSALGVKNGDVARALNMSEPSFSRFQQRPSVDLTEAEQYLRACGFDSVDEFMASRRAPWNLLDTTAPTWSHPNRDALLQIFQI
jgi:hypothetical protein